MSRLFFLYAGYSEMESVLSLIGLIILCVLIIAASYYTTKFVGKRQMGVQKGGNFTVIDTMRLSQTKYLQLVKMGEKYIVIAVSKDNISFITELSKDEVKVVQQRQANGSFKDVLASVMGKKSREAEVRPDKKTGQDSIEQQDCEDKEG